MKGFSYAFKGISFCIKTETNMRIHIVAAIYVLILAQFYDLSKAEIASLCITIFLVFALEMLNTAVESLVDLVSPEENKLAGIAKDTAAGAVLVSAISSVIVGAVIFWDKNVFEKIIIYFTDNILSLIGIILLSVLAYIFVFVLFKNK